MRHGAVYLASALTLLTSVGDLQAAVENPPQCADAPRPFDEILGAKAVLGALVIQVKAGSPAAQAGLSVGDFIESCNGQGVREFGTLEAFVQNLRETAMLSSALVNLWKLDTGSESYSPSSIELRLPARVGAQFGIALSLQAMVVQVKEGGVAETGGLRPGDFIEQVNGEHVADIRSATDLDLRVSDVASRHGDVKLVVGHWKALPPTADHTTAFVRRTEVKLSLK